MNIGDPLIEALRNRMNRKPPRSDKRDKFTGVVSKRRCFGLRRPTGPEQRSELALIVAARIDEAKKHNLNRPSGEHWTVNPKKIRRIIRSEARAEADRRELDCHVPSQGLTSSMENRAYSEERAA